MFSVGYGIRNRENKILKIAESEPSTAAILAAVHFEWMMKRSLLKLGCSPTSELRKKLEGVYRLGKRKATSGDYRSIWKEEVACRFKNAALGSVLGNLQTIQDKTMKVRGRIVHGNGTVPNESAQNAVEEFIRAGRKLTEFATKHGEDLDSKLKARIKPRKI